MQVSFRNDKKTLYLVSTPIGNLEDITFRAIKTLQEVAVIFAEDTRVTSKLLNHYNISKELITYHDHNRHDGAKRVIELLEEGLDVALVSDAGTPGISDPGYELVNYVIEAGFNVVSIPGASASITALTSSGLKMEPHLFVGFLPRKNSEIKSELEKILEVEATLIFYESPFRVKDTLNHLLDVLGDRKVAISRELTKMFETVIRTTLSEAITMEHDTRGEYVIIVEGYTKKESNKTIEELYLKYKDLELSEKDVFKKISLELGVSKRDVYQKIKIDNK